MRRPVNPKIYHIIHADKLPFVLKEGGLWCDAEMIKRPNAGTIIGMGGIKERRLSLPVICHPEDKVGDYVPFCFFAHARLCYSSSTALITLI